MAEEVTIDSKKLWLCMVTGCALFGVALFAVLFRWNVDRAAKPHPSAPPVPAVDTVLCTSTSNPGFDSIRRYLEESAEGRIDTVFRKALFSENNDSDISMNWRFRKAFSLPREKAPVDVCLGRLLRRCRVEWPNIAFHFFRLSRRILPGGGFGYDVRRNGDFLAAERGFAVPSRDLFQTADLWSAVCSSVLHDEEPLLPRVVPCGTNVCVIAAPPEVFNEYHVLASAVSPNAGEFFALGRLAGRLTDGADVCIYSNRFLYLVALTESPAFQLAKLIVSDKETFFDREIETGMPHLWHLPDRPEDRSESIRFESYIANCVAGRIDPAYRRTFTTECCLLEESGKDLVTSDFGEIDLSGLSRRAAIEAIAQRCRSFWKGKTFRFWELSRVFGDDGIVRYKFERYGTEARVTPSSRKRGNHPVRTLSQAFKAIPATTDNSTWKVTERGGTVYFFTAPPEVWRNGIRMGSVPVPSDAISRLPFDRLSGLMPPGGGCGCVYTNGVLYLIDHEMDVAAWRLFDCLKLSAMR
ncbi:MAG: hypothetical protein J5985_00870 [Kiritimatiellae bacterium]|nr:hypothetical protein [Kiritimatiellia bacterium]